MTNPFTKPLLIFAHRGEGKEFLLRDTPTPLPDFDGGRLYECDDYFLLICAEGITDAIFYSASVLSKYEEKISKAVNLGVAGRLTDTIPLNSIQSPRTVYCHNGREMQFTSFQNNKHTSFDLITTSSRILDKSSGEYLSKFGSFVDREAWGIGYVCQKFQKDCEFFKLISDNAGEGEICRRVRENNALYSSLLYKFFKETMPKRHPYPKKEKAPSLPQGFHFGQSQKRQFFNLIEALQYYPDEIIEDIKKTYPKKMPKEKTGLLLDRMKDISDPFTAQVKRELKRLSKDFYNDQFKLTYDQQCESSNILIKARIRDPSDFQSFRRRLENLPYEKIHTLLQNGPDDVP